MKRSPVVTQSVVTRPADKSPAPCHGRHARGRSSPVFCLALASLLLACLGTPRCAPAQSQGAAPSQDPDQSQAATPPTRVAQTTDDSADDDASGDEASDDSAGNDLSGDEASDTLADDKVTGSIDLDGVTTLAEALEAIGVDSGVTFRHRADPKSPISVNESPLTFWQALDAVLDQTSLDVDPYSHDSDVWRLTPRDPQRPSRVASAVYLGQYRIEPQTVTARRELIRPRLSGLQVGMRLAWEPELAPIGLSVPIASVSGELDDGTPLVPQDAAGTIDIATNRSSFSADFFLPLQLPDSPSRQISRLEGKIESMIPGDRGRFELALSDPVAEQTIGDMTVRIEGVRRQGDLVEVRLGIELENAGRSLESYRQWIFENRATVRLADGSDARHLGMEVYRQTVSGVGVGYLYDLGDAFDRLKLVYESPTSVIREETKFVFRDVPLP